MFLEQTPFHYSPVFIQDDYEASIVATPTKLWYVWNKYTLTACIVCPLHILHSNHSVYNHFRSLSSNAVQILKTTPTPTINAAIPAAAVFIGAAAPVYAIGFPVGLPFVPL